MCSGQVVPEKDNPDEQGHMTGDGESVRTAVTSTFVGT